MHFLTGGRETRRRRLTAWGSSPKTFVHMRLSTTRCCMHFSSRLTDALTAVASERGLPLRDDILASTTCTSNTSAIHTQHERAVLGVDISASVQAMNESEMVKTCHASGHDLRQQGAESRHHVR